MLTAVPDEYCSNFNNPRHVSHSDELAEAIEHLRELDPATSGRGDFLFHHSEVQRGTSQRPNSWHTDGLPQLITASELPTEFIVGSLTMTREFIKMQEVHKTKRGFLFDLGKALSYMDKSQLGSHGVRAWSAEPHQVVRMTGEDLHRSPKNPTQQTVNRKFLLVR